MRRSASEIIRNLEMRIARLERNATPNALADFIDFCMKYDLKETGDLAEVNQVEFLNLIARNKFGAKGLKLRNRQVMLTSFGEQVLNENMRVARLERQADSGPSMELSHFVKSDLEDYNMEYIEMQSAKACKKGGYCYFIVEDDWKACAIIHEDDRGNQKILKVWVDGFHEQGGEDRVEKLYESMTTGRELL